MRIRREDSPTGSLQSVVLCNDVAVIFAVALGPPLKRRICLDPYRPRHASTWARLREDGLADQTPDSLAEGGQLLGR